MTDALATITALAVALWCGIAAITVAITDDAATVQALHLTDFIPPKP